MTTSNMEFPLRMKRQYPEPFDADAYAETIAELDDIKTRANSYVGMIVSCKEDGLVYVLGTDMEFTVLSGGSNIDNTQASDTTTYSSNKIENDFAKKTELHSHDNKDALDLISSSGDMLLFNGKTTVIPTSKPSTVVAGSIWIETV